MSRAWDKAKTGAKWVGGTILAIGGAAALVAGVATGSVAVGAVIAGVALYDAVVWGAAGGVVGGLYGAVTKDSKPEVTVHQTVTTTRTRPVFDMEAGQEKAASQAYQNMIAQQRLQAAQTQR